MGLSFYKHLQTKEYYTMKDTTPYEVFCKLIGDIHPKGETNHDDISNNNLDQFLFNLQCLIEEASEVMQAPYYGEASIKEAREKVTEAFETAINYMQEAIES